MGSNQIVMYSGLQITTFQTFLGTKLVTVSSEHPVVIYYSYLVRIYSLPGIDLAVAFAWGWQQAGAQLCQAVPG
jgi:hypothetical protein